MIGYGEKQTCNRSGGLQVFKKRLQHRCFPVEYVNFQEQLWLLLKARNIFCNEKFCRANISHLQHLPFTLLHLLLT